MKTRIVAAAASVLIAAVTVTTTGTMAASANSPAREQISGTLHFCAAGPCPPALTWVGHLDATGPLAGTATVNVLSDQPNANFTKDQTTLSLSLSTPAGDDSILIAMTTQLTSSGPATPCPFDHNSTCVYFTEAGRWHTAFGTGPYEHLQGGGTLHTDGVAVNHATGKNGYSNVRYDLNGQISPA
jgi:hypothetical protein